MATRKNLNIEAQPLEKPTDLPNVSSVAINRAALTSLVTGGSADRVKQVYREAYRTARRLKLKAGSAPLLSPPDDPASTFPNVLDLQRWLDSLENNKKFKDDLDYLKQLLTTADSRLPKSFKDEVAKEFS